MKYTLITQNSTYDISESKNYDFYYIGDKNSFTLKNAFKFTESDIESLITVKVILKSEASFDVESLVVIPRGIKKVATFIKFDILNLSDTNHVRIVPSLEIGNNDVKAGHGATIKNIDPSHLKYMLSRGIKEEECNKILIEAFMNC